MEIVYNGKEWFSYFSSLRTAICGNEPRLVLVGRLSPRKGQDVALEAVRLLTEDGLYPSITFVGSVFDGYEWYASELTAAVRRYGLERQCSFVGFAEDVRPFLEEADIALVPSRTEPFGTVALEAMAAGRPVIASDVQGLSEIVQHRETGILVPPGDAVALSSAIHSLAMNSEMCSRLACQGLRRVRKDFSLEAYRESIVRLVEGAAR
jgi:glycosyltransferase involved in cell wall biosynthesis